MRDQVSQSETEPPEDRESRYFVQSLARGLDVLRCVGAATGGLSLTELAQRMQWSKGTAFRFVFTLQQLGYLEQDARTRRFRPSVRVLDLGFGCLNSLGLPERAHPYLEQLFAEAGCPVHLAVLDGADIVYVGRIADRSLTTINLYVGARLPAYCTSMGKVLLAFRPWDEVRRLHAGASLRAHTPHTLTGLEQLRFALEQIRRTGYGTTDQELELGVRSVAAPVRDRSGAVVAAVNISTAVARVDLETLHTRLAPALLRTAGRISAALGHAPETRLHPV